MNSKYRMIWQQMEGQRRRYGAAIGALVLGSCVLYLVPLVPQVIMDGVLADADGSGTASRFVQKVVTHSGGQDFLRANLWMAAVAIVLLTGIAGFFTYLRGRWSAQAAEGIARKVRDKLFDQLQHLPCRFHDGAETGDLVQRCTSDVDTLRQFLANQVVEIGRAGFMLLVPLPLMLALDARMTLASVVLLPPIVAFAVIFFRKVKSAFLLVDEAEGALTASVQENLTGIRVVRAFARQDHEMEKFAEKNMRHRRLDYRLYALMGWYWSISDLMCMAQLTVVLGAGGYLLAQGQLQVGTFYFFLAAVNLFIWPVRMMGRILTELGKATVAIGRIDEILGHPRESDPVSTLVPSSTSAGEIVFDRVNFAHNGDTRVLQEISFRVEPGETIALLGPSGSGKSTLVSLLLRFYDPESGEIRIDGRDIMKVSRKDVRSRIAVVMQEPFLYSKSLRENIRLGRSNAADDEITEAASVACVHDAILEFDDSYDTLVGERGVTLSGGQRQRVALARALLDSPSVLILDDALSAVDTNTESMILEALRDRKGRQTTLVIAHRLSTLMSADRILVLDKGRIIQQGTHRNLVEQEGLYRRLWRIQTSVEEQIEETFVSESKETIHVAT